MIKTSRFALILVLLVAIGSWIGSNDLKARTLANGHSKNLYQGTITIGLVMWPGYLPLFVAQEKGYFSELGLDVEIKIYDGLGELSKSYVAGEMQGRANLTLDAVNENLNGLDHKAVLAIDYSNGSDGIAATENIETVAEFKGKRDAYDPNSMGEFFLTWVLDESGLTIADIVPVHASAEDALSLLTAGKVDAAVSYEPFLSKFVKAPDFHVFFSSADAPNLLVDVLTFRSDFIEAYPGTVQAIVQAYFKAFQFWKDHREEANAILARAFSDTPEGIAEQLKGVTMLDEGDNQVAFTFAVSLQSLYGNMRQVGKFIRKRHEAMLTPLDTDKLIEPRFVKNLMKEED